MAKFPAKFYDGKQAIAHSVHVTLEAESLRVHKHFDTLAHWLYSETVIIDRAVGSFSAEKDADALLVIENKLDADALISRIPFKQRRKIDWKLARHIALLMAIIVALVFVVIPLAVPHLLPLVPRHWDTRIGEFAENGLFKSEPRCTNPEGLAAINGLANRLAAPLKLPYTIKVEVLDDAMVNAFALPGGKIYFFRGLIAQAKNPEEIAGILAHEIGHSYHRHGTEVLIRDLSATLVLDVLTGGSGSTLYAAKALSDVSHSRSKERQADRFAIDLLAKHRLDPRGLAGFFARMQEKKSSGDTLYGLEAFFNTHPNDAERQTMAKAAFKRGFTYRSALSQAEWQALKTVCKPAPAPVR